MSAGPYWQKGKQHRPGRLVPAAAWQAAKPKIMRTPRGKTLGITVSAETERAIVNEAARRGIAKCTLVRDLIEEIIDSGLFAAVLDE